MYQMLRFTFVRAARLLNLVSSVLMDPPYRAFVQEIQLTNTELTVTWYYYCTRPLNAGTTPRQYTVYITNTQTVMHFNILGYIASGSFDHDVNICSCLS